MPLTPEEQTELQMLQGYIAGQPQQAASPPQGGLSPDEQAELDMLMKHQTATASQQQEPQDEGGFMSKIAGVGRDLGEFAAKPFLDARDIYQQAEAGDQAKDIDRARARKRVQDRQPARRQSRRHSRLFQARPDHRR